MNREYHIRILAERSTFSGCTFCEKREMIDPKNPQYLAASTRWKEIENNPINEEMGKWWNELRLSVIKNEERELEQIRSRHYEYCSERASSKFNSELILFNWRTIARHVLAPIIYRYFLVAILLTCFVMVIMILSYSDFEWKVKGICLLDFIAIIIILVQECSAIYAFSRSRQLHGKLRRISALLGTISLICVVIHLICAIVIGVLAMDSQYKDKRTIVIIYLVTLQQKVN